MVNGKAGFALHDLGNSEKSEDFFTLCLSSWQQGKDGVGEIQVRKKKISISKSYSWFHQRIVC